MGARLATIAARFIRWDSPVGWGVAGAAALGAWLFPAASTWCWVAFFLIAATLCGSSYRERCGRRHCRITGPLFLLAAGYLALVQMDLAPFVGNGWFTGVVLGTVALAFLAELVFGAYVAAR